MANFYISVSNGLLKNGHRQRMGEAVWEFMWLIDKITKIDEKGMGLILGGKPINLDDLADDLGVHKNTVCRNLEKLEREKYIVIKRAPYGLIIGVNKAKKRFNRNGDSTPKTESPEVVNLVNINGDSLNRNGDSNIDNNISKTISVDNIGEEKMRSPAEVMKEFLEAVEKKDEKYLTLIGNLEKKNIARRLAEEEVDKFCSYWTEPTKSGRKMRWETEKTFEVSRRLMTWFNNYSKFSKGSMRKQTYHPDDLK